jgi:tetratricopeptide (TPR) repeat protein
MKSNLITNRVTTTWLAFVFIIIVGVVIYSNIYQVPFIFDGIMQIEDKVKIRDLKNYCSPRVLLSPRLLVDFTFALNYRFGKLNVFGYHLVNVIIHIINGLLVYFLALAVFKQLINRPAQRFGHSNSPKSEVQNPKSQADPKIGTHDIDGRMSEVVLGTFQSTIDKRKSAIFLMSLFAALIFVAHPIQTQAVTYTVQRYASMAAMFYFLSILFYLKARIVAEGSKFKAQSLGKHPPSAFNFQLSAYFAVSFICGILAFLSKQNTASLPGAIFLVEYLFFDRTWQGWKRKLLWFAPTFVLIGIFILYVSGLFRGEIQMGSLLEDVSGILRAYGPGVSPWIYLCTQLNVAVIYIRLLFLPVDQNLDYMYPFKTGFFDGYTPLAFLFLVAIVGLAIWNGKKRPIITFGIFWFFITLSIESSIFSITDALFEHRLYLPMFGFGLVIAYMVFCHLPIKPSWCVILFILVIASLGTATFLRNRTYENGITLWSDVVSKSPLNFRAYYNLGNALYKSKRMETAIKSYSEALRIKQNFAVAHLNLGVALMEVGRLDNAISHLTEAMRIKPGDAAIHNNLGNALIKLGRLQNAVLHLSEAIRIAPKFAQAHNNLGIALAQQGNLKDAMVHFSEALRTEPNNPKVHSNLGQAFMLQGDLPRAAHHYSEAVRINPGYAEAHCKLGVILVRQGDVDGGIEHFSTALKIQPGMNEARQGINQALRLKDLKNPPYR